MPLDEIFWDDISPQDMPPQLRQAIALYGRRCTYVSLHDWQCDPPNIPTRLADTISLHTTADEITSFSWVRRELPLLADNLRDGAPEEGWSLAALRLAGTVEPWAWSLMVPWDYDPLVAFHQFFWVNPAQRSRNSERDGLALLSLFFAHLHELAKAGYLAIVSTVDNPIVRAVACSRFPVLDALDIRISMEGK